jgi:hypothetical protein
MKYLLLGVVALTITPTIDASLIPSLGWGFFIVGMFVMAYRDLRDPQSTPKNRVPLSTTNRRPTTIGRF